MANEASEAARALSIVLTREAKNLDSDVLTTVADAMTVVRRAARDLESALTGRGWGGGVLYGFGDNDGPEDEAFDGDLEPLDAEEDDPDEAGDGPWSAPGGVRMTYQARFDFVVVDPAALLTYVETRLAQSGMFWTREQILDHDPFYLLTRYDGLGEKDYAGAGLVSAGGQEVSHEVPMTLWEMADEASDDQFPTSM